MSGYQNLGGNTLITPIERLLKTGKTITRNDNNGNKPDIFDEYHEQTLNDFGGSDVRLIYDAEDKLVEVRSEGSVTKLVYGVGDKWELDHVKTMIPGKEDPKDKHIRTNLDYTQDDKRLLEDVYSEIIGG